MSKSIFFAAPGFLSKGGKQKFNTYERPEPGEKQKNTAAGRKSLWPAAVLFLKIYGNRLSITFLTQK